VDDPVLTSNFLQHLMMADIARHWAYGHCRTREQARDALVTFILNALGYAGDIEKLKKSVGETIPNKELENDTESNIS